MNRTEAKNYCREHLKEYVESITQKDNKAGKNMYICPICHSGEKKDGAFSLQDNHFHCFSCNEKGDIFNLIEKIEKITFFNEQLEFACSFFNIDLKTSSQSEKKQAPQSFLTQKHKTTQEQSKTLVEPQFSAEKQEFKKKAKDYIEKCSKNIEKTNYLFSRAFNLQTLKNYKIGYDTEKNCIVIPYSAEEDYYITRSCAEKRFYKPNSDKAGYEPIFNEQALYSDNEPVFVCESPLDALSLIQAGGKAIALGGTGSTKLIKKLEEKKSACSLILSFDNDEPGKKATELLAEELKNLNFSFSKAKYSYELYFGNKKDANDLLKSNEELLRKDVKNNIMKAKKIIVIKNKNQLSNFEKLFEDALLTKKKIISTGYVDLDKVLSGGIMNELFILGGMSGCGKSAFAQNIAENIAEKGINVLYFALEMKSSEIIARGISKISKIQKRKGFNDKSFSVGEILKLSYDKKDNSYKEIDSFSFSKAKEEYFSKYGNNFFIYDGIKTVLQIKQEIENFIKENGTDIVVFIDYIQMITSENVEATAKQKVDSIIRNLKEISNSYNIPIFTISSLNRSGYHEEQVSVKSFKESGDLEYTADIIMGLTKAKEKYGYCQLMNLSIIKNRNGESGKNISLCFFEENNEFENNIIERKYENDRYKKGDYKVCFENEILEVGKS